MWWVRQVKVESLSTLGVGSCFAHVEYRCRWANEGGQHMHKRRLGIVAYVLAQQPESVCESSAIIDAYVIALSLDFGLAHTADCIFFGIGRTRGNSYNLKSFKWLSLVWICWGDLCTYVIWGHCIQPTHSCTLGGEKRCVSPRITCIATHNCIGYDIIRGGKILRLRACHLHNHYLWIKNASKSFQSLWSPYYVTTWASWQTTKRVPFQGIITYCSHDQPSTFRSCKRLISKPIIGPTTHSYWLMNIVTLSNSYV